MLGNPSKIVVEIENGTFLSLIIFITPELGVREKVEYQRLSTQ
jgi:hypothetical protein